MNKNITLKEIETYGSEVQTSISEHMSALVGEVRCIDLGKTGEYMAELSDTANNITKSLNTKAYLKPFIRGKKWLAKFNNIESSINNISNAVNVEISRLDGVLNGLIDTQSVLSRYLDEYAKVHSDLSELVEYFQSGEGKMTDPDGIKLQAAVYRLKTIASTEAVTKQEQIKTALIIKENKEIVYQLRDAADNLIPIFKTMMMNVLATKVNDEAVKLRKNLIKTANRVIIDNAKQIEETAHDLSAGRKEALISPQTIEEANQILQNAVKSVIDSSSTEVQDNIDLIESLQRSSRDIRNLSRSLLTADDRK